MLKQIDIFQHLKQAIKNTDLNCKCKNTEKFYCIPCKLLVCSKCNLNLHKDHIIINKKDFKVKEDTFQKAFKDVFDMFKTDLLFSDPKGEKEKLFAHVNETCDKAISNISKLRKQKLNEIDALISNLASNSAELRKKIDATILSLNSFYKANNNFFTEDDDSNFYFLLTYDFLSTIDSKKNDIFKLRTLLDQDYDSFDTKLQYYTMQKEKELKSLFDETPSIKEKNKILACYNKGKEESIFVENRKEFPELYFNYNSNKLNSDFFNVIEQKTKKFSSQINAVKQNVFTMYKKNKNLDEISKFVNIYENTNGIEQKLFSSRKTKTNLTKTGGSLNTTAYKMNPNDTKDSVKLNHPLVQRYFEFLILDTYSKNFKAKTKELQSSHADLKITPSEDDEGNKAKAIEGTSDITFFDKKNRTMIRKRLELTKNPFGYTKFPTGSRSLLVGDKLYISGGRDEKCTFANVIVYDIREDKLKRIMNMNSPRCYHTMVLNTVFDTIMVIGGEDCNDVEIFDPLTNRWQLLPQLNIPRCNPFFYFDSSKGYFYTMFGIEGKYVEGNYCDSIEILDLANVGKGWVIPTLKNSADILLKSLLYVFPMENFSGKFVIYGGLKTRANDKTVCLLDLNKNEVVKIDKKIINQIWEASQNNKKLKNIVSSIKLFNTMKNK